MASSKVALMLGSSNSPVTCAVVGNTYGYCCGSTNTAVVADRVVYGLTHLSWRDGRAFLRLLEK